MKIQGTNQPNKVNPYQAQFDKQKQLKTHNKAKADQLQISEQAKKMQESDQVHPTREARVEALRQEVEADRYQIKPDLIAKKLLQYWK
ncbi:anti-sigma-28 factor, FlgM family [Amphibacillus marinus]|uniref:Negative regulator of flagellin synthesis n=1 Tax=Amphibacillus marinus TaxID=872970 RepID=A0A1H8QYU9_9BACI|nr:flagellar biosynthesis anti-sigma factor FlgM [Amphibacillus marinus]SEO59034.1 anti-sigma-28 factor, FlgM family [Amphibacillus marinus]